MNENRKENTMRANIRAFVKKYASKERTLEIGCGYSHYSEYFPNRIGMDIISIPTVDIVADAHDLHMFKEDEFDRILCTEVLEHLHTPQKAVDEMFRVLKKGGVLILTTRFIFPLHDVPCDYYRFTKYGLRHLLKNFEITEMKEEVDTFGTLAMMLQRIGFQTNAYYFKPLSGFSRWIWVRLWVLLSRIIKPVSLMVAEEFCEEGDKKIKLDNIMTSGYYVACKKI